MNCPMYDFQPIHELDQTYTVPKVIWNGQTTCGPMNGANTDSVQSVIKMAPHHFSNFSPGPRFFPLLPVGSTVTT